ncbi:2OG-Fe(II) oxygenase [Pseudomonas sp. NFXW11]|uniref:2OG-Fe(II) oxygenase n=1 Tax=Pseudomonas sp. NFXW11 TaxID=2819531 RepID=UPI003CEA7665
MNSFAELLLASAAVPSASVELPLGDSVRCVLVHGFLSASECQALIEATENCGFVSAGPDYPSSYRDNDRIVADDPALAQRLFERLTHCASRLPELGTVLDEDGWRRVGINERLRFCRYRPGSQFRAHQDGVHHRQGSESRLTFMIYLNDHAFSGGETLFFEERSAAMANQGVTLSLRPRQGSLILFDHRLWHAGAMVESGQKYVMRSDLMYEPEHCPQAEGPFQPGHRGYLWALADLGDRGFASAGRDASIRLWDRQGSGLGQLEGHTQSILGLVESAPGELVSHSRDRTIRHWCLASGKSKVLGTADSAVLSSAKLSCGRLVTGTADGSVTLWNLETGAADSVQAHDCWVWALAPLADGGFASASEDGRVKLWQPEGWRCTQVIDLGRPLRTLATWVDSEAGIILAAGDIDGRVHLLAIDPTLKHLDSLDAHYGPVRRVRFEARQVLLTCGEDGLVRRWDLRSRQSVVIGQHENFATDVLPMGGGGWISCGYDGRIIMQGAKA